MTPTGSRIRDLLRSIEKRAYTPRTRAAYLRKCGFEVGESCYLSPTDLESRADPALLTIGNHVAIAIRVSILTHDPPERLTRGAPGVRARGPVVIRDNCFIGARAVICPDVRIGPNSIVGCGAVVVSDVPPDTVVSGVPARPFGSLERYRRRCLERWAEQKPSGVRIEPGADWWSSRHLAANRELLREHLTELFQDYLTGPSGGFRR